MIKSNEKELNKFAETNLEMMTNLLKITNNNKKRIAVLEEKYAELHTTTLILAKRSLNNKS